MAALLIRQTCSRALLAPTLVQAGRRLSNVVYRHPLSVCREAHRTEFDRRRFIS